MRKTAQKTFKRRKRLYRRSAPEVRVREDSVIVHHQGRALELRKHGSGQVDSPVLTQVKTKPHLPCTRIISILH